MTPQTQEDGDRAGSRPGSGLLSRRCLNRTALIGSLLALTLSACRRAEPPVPAAPHPAQTTGVLQLDGLLAPVTVVRDAAGIPHISAANTDDLFFAQGFVQAQDRLFQMDLWKRSVQGRLSEVLGANFLQRDSMTRRIQFRGDLEQEWASYGSETHRIAVAFTSGINAWVRLARLELPEEFVAAGWRPELWRPEDLLNRTDAFLGSTGALDELLRARLVSALGSARVAQLLPPPLNDSGRTVHRSAADLSAITFVVPDALRQIGTPPFFLTLAGAVSDAARPGDAEGAGLQPGAASVPVAGDRPAVAVPEFRSVRGGAAWAVGSTKSETGGALLAVVADGRYQVPSSRYLVHLTAPGWNVIGATSPWLPGVVIGHNDRIAWGMVPAPVDTQDIYVERVNPGDPHQVDRDGHWVDVTVDLERIEVKGRSKPVQFERLYTSNGTVIAQDKERNLLYALRWTGSEPGGAGELAALSLNRSSSWPEFRVALSHWKVPTVEFVYADVDGHVGTQRAGLVPVRADGAGALPDVAWSSATKWRGFTNLADSAGSLDPLGGLVVAVAGAPARASRITGTLKAPGLRTGDELRALARDVTTGTTSTLVPLLDNIRSIPQEIEPIAAELRGFNGVVDGVSPAGTRYVAWESAIRHSLAKQAHVPEALEGEFAASIDPMAVLNSASPAWFPVDMAKERESVMVNALIEVARQVGAQALAPRTLTFEHPLAVFDSSRRRFNVGPFVAPGSPETVSASNGKAGTIFSMVLDARTWDRSSGMNPVGQSGSPASRHYADLAPTWSGGQPTYLSFNRISGPSTTSETLVLQPRQK